MQKLGALFVALAVITWAGWTLWVNSRTWCPIHVPLSLAENSRTTTHDFKVNVSGHYDIGVEATASNAIPLKELTCQLGTGPLWPEKTCSTTGILRASWKVMSGPKTVSEGTSDSETGGWTAEGGSQTGRTIGGFDATKGETLTLAVVTLQNADSLSSTSPSLTVTLHGTVYESALVVSGVLRLVCAVVAFLGLVLLGISFRKRRAVLST